MAWTGLARPGGRGGSCPSPPSPTFLSSKKKKGRKRQKRKSFKAETIKRLSPRSKYYCFSDSRASRIRKFYTQIWNPFWRPWCESKTWENENFKIRGIQQLPWTYIPRMDKWEVPNLQTIRYIKSSIQEVEYLVTRVDWIQSQKPIL